MSDDKVEVEGKPIQISDDQTLHVEPKGEPEGEAKLSLVEHKGGADDARERMRRACKSGTRAWKNLETPSGAMRKIASIPKQEHTRMLRECGQDQDKQEAWLQNNPQFLTSRQVKQDLPNERRATVMFDENPLAGE